VYEFARGTFTRLTVEEDDDNPRVRCFNSPLRSPV
jgi:hypothetical protein